MADYVRTLRPKEREKKTEIVQSVADINEQVKNRFVLLWLFKMPFTGEFITNFRL